MKDLIIIGGSAAGVSAAIYAARRKLDFSLIAGEWGGEVALSGEIENYPGMPQTNGIELTDKFKEHLKHYDIIPDEGVWVEKIEPSDGKFRLVGRKNESSWGDAAKAVLIATGQHPRLLGVPGEKEYKNRGVSYCTVCDGPLFKGKDVVIVGGGNTANEAGIMMNGIAKSVTVINKNSEMKGDAVLIQKLKEGDKTTVVSNATTTEILGNGTMVTGLAYKNEGGEKKEITADGVFIHIGYIPNTDFLRGLVRLDDYGQVAVSRLGETSVPGIFAAGDVTDIPYKQIGIAVGEGITAALSVVDYLNKLSS